VAQILVNARQHRAPAPKPTKNFFAEGPSIESLGDLNAYLAKEKALLAQLAVQEPNEIVLVHISFARPITASELRGWKQLTAWSRPQGTLFSSTRVSAAARCR